MKLKNYLKSLYKSELLDFAYSYLPMGPIEEFKKTQLIDFIYDHIINKCELKNLLITLDPDWVKLIFKAIEEDGIYVRDNNYRIFCKIEDIFVGTINQEEIFTIFDDIKELLFEIYTEEYKELHTKLNWIYKCIKFSSVFYHTVPLDIFMKLVRRNRKVKIDNSNIRELFNMIPSNINKMFYDEDDDTLYSYIIDGEQDFRNYVAYSQDDKDFYIPLKSEIEELFLIEYINNPYYDKFFGGLGLPKPIEEIFAAKTYLLIATRGDYQSAMQYLIDGLELDQSSFESFTKVFMMIYNSTKTVFNRGYSPMELREKYQVNFDPKNVRITPGSSRMAEILKDVDIDQVDTNLPTGHRLYPNDLCHCGSGKKYKECCMLKDQFNLN